MKKNKEKILAIIPARGGSRRIPNKNIRPFNGKPLIYYTIKQAKDSCIFDRIIVDTDSPKIAKIAKKYGAEVPFLRPPELAQNTSLVRDSILHLLGRLEKDDNYKPSHIVLLQTTSPLREIEDIKKCWQLMKTSGATTTVTVCAPRPKPNDLCWLNGVSEVIPVNLTTGPQKSTLYGYNGLVFVIKTSAFLKEKNWLTRKTAALICPEWKSINIDVTEEFVLAEFLYKNKSKFMNRLNLFDKKSKNFHGQI